MTLADIIQICIFGALVWYSIETHYLRKEQKKAVYASMFAIEMNRYTSREPGSVPKDYPLIFRKIVEKGEFDPKELFSRGWHQDI